MSGRGEYEDHAGLLNDLGRQHSVATAFDPSVEASRAILRYPSRRFRHPLVLMSEHLADVTFFDASPLSFFGKSSSNNLHVHTCKDAFQYEYGDVVQDSMNQRSAFRNQCVDIGEASRRCEYEYEQSKHFSE